MASECAWSYYLYGVSLLEKARSDSDVFGAKVQDAADAKTQALIQEAMAEPGPADEGALIVLAQLLSVKQQTACCYAQLLEPFVSTVLVTGPPALAASTELVAQHRSDATLDCLQTKMMETRRSRQTPMALRALKRMKRLQRPM